MTIGPWCGWGHVCVPSALVINAIQRSLSLQIHFTLTPSASTPCVGIKPGSNPNIDCGAYPL